MSHVPSSRIRRVRDLWRDYNARFFGGKMTLPRFRICRRSKDVDGYLISNSARKYTIGMHIGVFSGDSPLLLEATLLHEMVHQYQAQILRVPMDHGPVFRSVCRQIEKQTRYLLRG